MDIEDSELRKIMNRAFDEYREMTGEAPPALDSEMHSWPHNTKPDVDTIFQKMRHYEKNYVNDAGISPLRYMPG